MTKDEIKEIVFNYIKEHRGTSFVEIERVFEENGYDYKGKLGIVLNKEFSNIAIWDGWNNEAIDIILELQKEKRIIKEPSEVIVYMIDGKCLDFPIATEARHYKSPHWIPVEFRAINGG